MTAERRVPFGCNSTVGTIDSLGRAIIAEVLALIGDALATAA